MTHKHTSFPAENLTVNDDFSPREIHKEDFRSGSAVSQNKTSNLNSNGVPNTPGSYPKASIKEKSAKRR